MIAELKRAVQESGRSLSAIARDSGLSQSQLSRFVAGTRTLSLESAAKLFAALGLRVLVPASATQSEPPAPTAKKKPKK